MFLHDAEMRLVDEMCEPTLFDLDGRRGEVDDPLLAQDIVDAVTFRACALCVLAGEEIEDGGSRTPVAFRRLGTGQRAKNG